MTPKPFLTPKQKQVLDFIQGYVRENDYAPSQQEIAKHFGFSSLGTVQHYLNQLEQQGYLQKTWNARRGLLATAPAEDSGAEAAQEAIRGARGLKSVSREKSSLSTLPVLGRVAAGRPIEAAHFQKVIEVPPFLRRSSGEHFVLEVQGDSMIDEGILDGDYVVIRKQAEALNGETVVAMINQGATIKKYFRKKGQKDFQIELHPANSAYQPMVFREGDATMEFRIEGVLVGLVRRFPSNFPGGAEVGSRGGESR